jgi:hypothetical protein
MAIEANTVKTRLQLRLKIGQDAQGNPVFKTRSYSNVKTTAGDEDVYEVGLALVSLQKHELEDLYRINELILEED